MKILTAEIYHETNTFSCRKTDVQAFKDRLFLFAAEAIAERGKANTELAGFLQAGSNHGWQIDHVLSASAGPGSLWCRGAASISTAVSAWARPTWRWRFSAA